MPEGKKTPLYGKHLQLGGNMVNYCGWLLPVQYEGIVTEVRRTRQKAGLFDVSHMGRFTVEGAGATGFLQKVATADIGSLDDNAIGYSPLCFEDGGTVDDILIYRYNSRKYLLVVNAANSERDLAWLRENLAGDVAVTDISPETASMAIQGPNSQAILSSLTKLPLDRLGYYRFIPAAELDGKECIVSRTGYTGEDGFEVYCAASDAAALWEAIWNAAMVRELGLTPAGLGSRDVLRLEAGLPLYGHELSEELTPIDAGLERFIAFAKEPGFIGREALIRQKEDGDAKKLAGLILLERGVIREGYSVKAGGKEAGRISSGSYSPTLERSIGMAYLNPAVALPGSEVAVVVRERPCPAQVVKIPFYRRRK